jgi:hypothetical protein
MGFPDSMKNELRETLNEAVAENQLTRADADEIYNELTSAKNVRSNMGWKGVITKAISDAAKKSHTVSHNKPKPNLGAESPYCKQTSKSAVAGCAAFRHALHDLHLGVNAARSIAEKAAHAAAAAGGGKSRRAKHKKTRKAKRSRRA